MGEMNCLLTPVCESESLMLARWCIVLRCDNLDVDVCVSGGKKEEAEVKDVAKRTGLNNRIKMLQVSESV